MTVIRIAIGVATIVAMLSPAACGGDTADPRIADRERRADQPRSNAPRLTNVGGRIARDRLVKTFAAMQAAFRAGDMAAVCTRVSDFGLGQFPPGGAGEPEAPCTAKLTEFAGRLRRRGTPPPRLRLEWVRIYQDLGIAGITVSDRSGERIRIPFRAEDGAQRLELGFLNRPDTLNGTLTRGPKHAVSAKARSAQPSSP